MTEPTPSVTGVEVIGGIAGDFALNVGFEEEGRDEWFAPTVVEFLDHSPRTHITVGSAELVRNADGSWRHPR